jgi:hypothetical protein
MPRRSRTDSLGWKGRLERESACGQRLAGKGKGKELGLFAWLARPWRIGWWPRARGGGSNEDEEEDGGGARARPLPLRTGMRIGNSFHGMRMWMWEKPRHIPTSSFLLVYWVEILETRSTTVPVLICTARKAKIFKLLSGLIFKPRSSWKLLASKHKG